VQCTIRKPRRMGFMALERLYLTVIYLCTGCAGCRGGEDVTAECCGPESERSHKGRHVVEWNSSVVRRATEQPAVSREDWDTMVLYNEKILQNKQNLTTTWTEHPRRLQEEHTDVKEEMSSRSIRVPMHCIEHTSYKPPKPPKPASLQTTKRLLPVQQYLNRQVRWT